MKSDLLRALALLVALLVAPSAAFAQSRVALVIGNADYANTAPLGNPVNDAEDVAAALGGAGFKVTLLRNATKRQFDQALAQFARVAPGSEAALFYFAGHGMQFQGHNFVMPVDAELQDQISLRYEMVGVDDVRDALEASPGVKIMVLDSCRDNPLAARLVRSMATLSRDAPIQRGLAPAEPIQGMVIVYATQAGQVALDGSGRNSPFAKAFVEELAVPGLEVAALFRDVEHKVVSATGGRQSPELSISGVPDYYLTPRPADDQDWAQIRDGNDPAAFRDFLARFPTSAHVRDAQSRLAAMTAEPPPAPAAAATDDVEALFWQTALKYDRVSDYLAYLKRYPNGAFAPLAQDRIAVLSATPAAEAAKTAPGAAAAPRAVFPVDLAGAEATAWRSAEAADTPSGYSDYLSRFPNGIYAAEAARRVASLSAKPNANPPSANVSAPSAPSEKAANAAPEAPSKPGPASAPMRPAKAIIRPPSPRERRAQTEKPARQAAAPAPQKTEEFTDDRCPPHYFAHSFPSSSGYRCMPYP